MKEKLMKRVKEKEREYVYGWMELHIMDVG